MKIQNNECLINVHVINHSSMIENTTGNRRAIVKSAFAFW